MFGMMEAKAKANAVAEAKSTAVAGLSAVVAAGIYESTSWYSGSCSGSSEIPYPFRIASSTCPCVL